MLDPAGPNAAELLHRLGATAAEMHEFARRWSPSRPLTRPVYDAAKYVHLVERIGLGVEAGLLSREQYSAFQEAMSLIEGVLARTPATPETRGVIHADLKPDNVVVAGKSLVPIDFCFSGLGFYLFDVGGVLPALKPHLRQPFLDGYQAASRPFTDAETELVRACFLLSLFGGVGFSITKPSAHAWIRRRMPVWVEDYCLPYLRGELDVVVPQ